MRPDPFDLEPYRVKNILHTYGSLDVKVAWKMDGEVMQLPLKDVEHVLYEETWEDQTPFEAAADHPHWGLVLEADLSYPIIVTYEPACESYTQGTAVARLAVVDGRHRIMKAWLLGEEHIAAKMVDYGRLVELAEIPDDVYDLTENVASGKRQT